MERIFSDVLCSTVKGFKFSEPKALLGTNAIGIRDNIEVSGLIIHFFDNRAGAIEKITELSVVRREEETKTSSGDKDILIFDIMYIFFI